jgi:hypothetical protein
MSSTRFYPDAKPTKESEEPPIIKKEQADYRHPSMGVLSMTEEVTGEKKVNWVSKQGLEITAEKGKIC